MSFWQIFFGFEGRIRRRTFWLGVAALWFAILLAYYADLLRGVELIALKNEDDYRFSEPLWITAGVFFGSLWPMLALQIKRWHDRGKSGWWTLLWLVPFANIYAFVALYFLGSQYGRNAYGPNPKGLDVEGRTVDMAGR